MLAYVVDYRTPEADAGIGGLEATLLHTASVGPTPRKDCLKKEKKKKKQKTESKTVRFFVLRLNFT